MKRPILVPFVFVAFLAGCSTTPAKSPDVKDSVRTALDTRGLKDVSVSQDRDKGVVTLTGKVASEDQKAAAASVAQGIAVGQVVANEIVVTPPGVESDAKTISNALDDGIDSNMKALLVRLGKPKDVDYKVNAGVVTLTGSVNSQARRSDIEKAAAGVPNVKQVVNELQVKNQKATGRGGL
jgi:hyperosmotically inducible periplasmic protein